MIVLDTQHVSQLQRVGSADIAKLEAKLSQVPFDETWITIITPYEQIRAIFAQIHAARAPEREVVLYDFLSRLLEYYARKWYGRILTFDEASGRALSKFTPKLIRSIGPRDARIAAIALAHEATLLTSNVANFRQVPELQVVDWLRD